MDDKMSEGEKCIVNKKSFTVNELPQFAKGFASSKVSHVSKL